MPATPFDSAIYRDLFRDEEAGRLFDDAAEIRAMLAVEGELARVQGRRGMIPEAAGEAIHRASGEISIDPAALAPETGRNAVSVPALVEAFREAMRDPEHSRFAHWGATSQDIMETGLVLRLREFLALCESRLAAGVSSLGVLAETHAELPMAARTYGQAATVTSFGAVAAGWGRPLLRRLDELDRIRDGVLTVSLSGAAGTLSAMGPDGPLVRSDLAEALGLADPGSSWHAERDRIARLSGWMAELCVSLGKMGEDLILMNQTGRQELRLALAGGSSTMPQKSNPVLPSLIVALARHAVAQNGAISGAGLHREQRDGAAWLVEWLALPQLCMATARSLAVAGDLASGIVPIRENMLAGIDDGTGLIHAEALSFALVAARVMPRPEAQLAVKALCEEARADGVHLSDLAKTRWPGANLEDAFSPAAQLGTAPAEARSFAVAAARTARG